MAELTVKPTEKLRQEAIRYLGYKGGSFLSPDVDLLLRECIDEICKIAEPRITYRSFGVADVSIPGTSAEILLAQCDEVILMAATLGISVDRALSRAQIRDMTHAVILDSCAAAAIEEVSDDWQDALAAEYLAKNKYLTHRHSPGYGDMPLSMQTQFVPLLNAERKIGLTTARNFLLTPTKSITGVIGVSCFKQSSINIPCGVCNMRGTCYFRQRGTSCDKSSA
jgi:hypothetical protein